MKSKMIDDWNVSCLFLFNVVTAIGSSGVQANSSRHRTSKKWNFTNANYQSVEIPRIILQTSKFIKLTLTLTLHMTINHQLWPQYLCRITFETWISLIDVNFFVNLQVGDSSTRLLPTANTQQFGFDKRQVYQAQIPSFSAMPTGNSRISLGPVYQFGNEIQPQVND